MYQVVVVDDEPVALSHICAIIEKKCPEYQVIATAENGKDGLEKVGQMHPDLVISDVKMPVMDGIEMVTLIKEKYPSVFAIIVSGYSDFEYAKGALKSGVVDYILKPVIPSEMKKTLDNIVQKLKKHQYQQRNAIVHMLCNGAECSSEEIAHYFPYKRYHCAIIRRNGLPRRFSTNGNMEIFSDINELFTVYGRDEMESLYIIPGDMLLGEKFEEYLLKLSGRFKIDKEYITIVYKKRSFPVKELQEHVKCLYRSLDTVSVVGLNQMINIDADDMGKMLPMDYDSIQIFLDSLEHLLKEQQYERLKKELRRLYYRWIEEKRPQVWMEYASRQILYLVRKYRENTLSLLECEYMIEDAFFYATTAEELADSLLDVMFKDIKNTEANAKIDSPDFFHMLENYIQNHLTENLSLQSLCRNFGVSQTYMGKLFRKYTDQSFNRYLTAVRMEKAIKLMKENPDIFIKDVAAMVGYSDQFYFSRIFRSYMGVCPSDYLDNLEKNYTLLGRK